MYQNIVAHIHDFNLLKQVKDIITQLKPVSTALDIQQTESTTIAS